MVLFSATADGNFYINTGNRYMTRKDKKPDRVEWLCQITGWILFILCAVVYLASGVKNKDILTITGSIFFLIACIVFMYPLLRKNGSTKD